MNDETRGWTRRKSCLYWKRINGVIYELLAYVPGYWFVYHHGVKPIGIVQGLAEAKRVAHRHAETRR